MSQTQSSKPTDAQATGRLVLIALVSLGLVARLAPVAVMESHWPAMRGDAAAYLEVGRSAAAGHGLTQAATADSVRHVAGVMPGYPLLIAAADLTGYGLKALIILQALAGTVTMVLAFLIARRLGGLWAGVVAMAVLVFDPLQVMACAVVLPAAVLGLALAATVAAGLAMLDGLARGSRAVWVWAGVAGLALAAAMYLEPLAGAVLAVAGLVAVIVRQRRRVLKTWAVALAVLVVALAPWLVRNTILLDRPVLTTNLGVQLLESNWPKTEEAQDEVERQTIHDETAGGNEVSINSYCWRAALERMAAHPGQWLARFGERVAALWSPESTTGLWPALPRLAGYTSLIPVAVLALAGMVVLCRRRPGALVWLLVVPVAMTLAHGFFGGGPQDRLPLMPILAALGGAGLAAVLGAGRKPARTVY
jgi:4-amino-4-deoxy-L-arabinose transferase-like glycosyltransferase